MILHLMRPMLAIAAINLIASPTNSEEKMQQIPIKSIKEQNYLTKGIQIKISKVNRFDIRFSAKNTSAEPILFKIQDIFITHKNTQLFIDRSYDRVTNQFVTPVDVRIQPNMTVEFYLGSNDIIKFPCKIYICDTLIAEVVDAF